jgi:hypothetical protein
VSSLRLSRSTSLAINDAGMEDPAAMPVLPSWSRTHSAARNGIPEGREINVVLGESVDNLAALDPVQHFEHGQEPAIAFFSQNSERFAAYIVGTPCSAVHFSKMAALSVATGSNVSFG